MEPQKNTLSSASDSAPRAVSSDMQNSADLPVLEGVTGTLREVVRDLPADNPASSQKATTPVAKKPVTPEEKKAQLLASLPADQSRAKRKMIGDIESFVDAQLSELNAQARHTSNPSQLNELMQKIRSLHHILEELAEAAFEYLRNLWLQMVHGLTV
ncbi:MAG: hypothetical protein AAB551_00660 [Patescibacteria group bacterium]